MENALSYAKLDTREKDQDMPISDGKLAETQASHVDCGHAITTKSKS